MVANKPGLQFNGHDTGDGELILKHAGKLGFEGVVSKTIDAPYAPGNRGLWRKAKALNRQEFVVVGWSDPEGSRPHLGALLLGYYADDGKLIYAGRVGTGMPVKVLADLRRRLDPLARKTSPLSVPPPRSTRFGSPLVLSRVHWVEPKLVAEITYLTWTADNLLRHTVYVGLREDKPPRLLRGRDDGPLERLEARLLVCAALLRRELLVPGNHGKRWCRIRRGNSPRTEVLLNRIARKIVMAVFSFGCQRMAAQEPRDSCLRYSIKHQEAIPARCRHDCQQNWQRGGH